MTFRNLVLSAAALAISLGTASAQGPLYDKVMVNLPYTVTVNDHTLQPGDYVIRQLPSPGGASRVLLIYSDNGMKFETSAMTIPTLDNRTPEDTKVILHHFGNDYYFDKIWIQGKNYGYEFVLPDSVKARERERMQPINVAATYQSVPEETTTTTTTTTESAQTTAPPAAETTPAPAETTPAPAETTPAPSVTENNTVAQNNVPEANEANRTMPQETAPAPAERRMPATAANWVMMLLGGGFLSGAGFAVRRIRG